MPSRQPSSLVSRRCPQVRLMSGRPGCSLLALLSSGIVLLASGAVYLAADWWMGLPEGKVARYVGRRQCARCHPKETQLWARSDHDRAMDLATHDTVLGDFDDLEFTHSGVTSRMFRSGHELCI